MLVSCKCGRRLLMALNDNTCLLCGHGDVRESHGVDFGLWKLPRDLRVFVRCGHPSPARFLNVRRA